MTIEVLVRGAADAPAVFLLSGDPAREAGLRARLSERALSLVRLSVPDWNADLSPWPAPPAFARGDAFTGRAGAFLEALCTDALPRAFDALGFAPAQRALAGCSLAGLFSLYAMTRAAPFDAYASVSGSLWFDGFLPYMEAELPSLPPRPVYLSLGEREAHTRNARLSQVQACTERLYALLLARGFPAALRLHPGGHFQDGEARMAAAIEWTLCALKGDER